MSATEHGEVRPFVAGVQRTQKRRETRLRVTPAQALDMLQSALRYCQRSGLAVNVADTEGGLTLTLPKVQSVPTPEGARFALRVEGELAR